MFGGAGQVGRAISALLPPDGWRVICASRIDANITRAEDVRRLVSLVEPDVIVNAAAFTAVDKAESVPKWAARVNGTGAGIVADAALQLGAPIIHLSTDYVFDGRSSRPWCETDSVGPLSVYGATKEAGEQAVRRIHSGHVILRTSWVFGSQGDNFVKTMLRQAKERPLLRIVGRSAWLPHIRRPISPPPSGASLARLPCRPAMSSARFIFPGAVRPRGSDFAKAIFAEAMGHGLASPRLEPIATAGFSDTGAPSGLFGSRLRQDRGCLRHRAAHPGGMACRAASRICSSRGHAIPSEGSRRMKVEPLALSGVSRVTHDVFRDERGAFMETWQSRKYATSGIDQEFVQDNWSELRRGVLRGLHYQLNRPQGKLVAVVAGEIFDVVVDLRRTSPTFGQWISETLSADRGSALWGAAWLRPRLLRGQRPRHGAL